MQPQTILAGLACLGLASATPSNLERRQAPGASGCAERLHVIGAGGANYSDPYAWGKLQSLANTITSRIPGSDAVSLPYDKVKLKKNPAAIPGGVTNLQNYVTQYTAACPNTKIALIGYSSGAVIMSNGLCTGVLDTGLADNTSKFPCRHILSVSVLTYFPNSHCISPVRRSDASRWSVL